MGKFTEVYKPKEYTEYKELRTFCLQLLFIVLPLWSFLAYIIYKVGQRGGF